MPYIVKRLLLVPPTLLIILLVNFIIIQTAPGGPIEKLLSQISHNSQNISESALADVNDYSSSLALNSDSSAIIKYQGANGVDKEMIEKLEKDYGFDKPIWQRFYIMLVKYLQFDFGQSFYQDKDIIDLIIEKLPVSLSLGIWSALLVYLISIPLGIKKAVQDGTRFDISTSAIIIFLHAIPSFLFAILLIILFAGGNFFNIFPMRSLVSDNFHELGPLDKILDYMWHMFLPILSMIIGGFASLTFFVKNSFIEEINKQYVLSAYAKGLSQKKILYRHIFRNAMLIIIAGIPAALISILFTSSMLIEVIFSLDGLGRLGYEAALSRDYPLIFASLYIFTLLGLITNIVTDLTYKLVDPRINFDK